ncbi:MAG: winged helix DNA-binding domain-containing protein [Defluviitaleaceae bacterium]|nr:winged helix DNA-binding domain-containing protein [Defluviitaleaceae bacterium]MCL2835987.1 winged helix DNA-binding domain-containing protein [Defluviitaleaceae bacterium]
MDYITNQQARRFMLLKQGLLGDHKFMGKQGALDFFHQAGCVQFDPVDVCGKNAEIVLQSRVLGFTKDMLDELLYTDRELLDYFDKCMSIILKADWPYFRRYREKFIRYGAKYPDMVGVMEYVRKIIRDNGAVCSSDINIAEKIDWHWNLSYSPSKNIPRASLEYMYFIGELIICRKNGTRKFYDLAERYLSPELLNAPDPLPDEIDYIKWRVLRRIGAVGFLWNKPSDAFLEIEGIKTERNRVFEELLNEGKITELNVEGMKDKLYCLSGDRAILHSAGSDHNKRCELLAPLDSFLWDRKLIKALFEFEYTWEIYRKAEKRKYGYYILPLLLGDRLIGRAEITADYKNNLLTVKNCWFEPFYERDAGSSEMIANCFKRFAMFNRCELAGITGF